MYQRRGYLQYLPKGIYSSIIRKIFVNKLRAKCKKERHIKLYGNANNSSNEYAKIKMINTDVTNLKLLKVFWKIDRDFAV